MSYDACEVREQVERVIAEVAIDRSCFDAARAGHARLLKQVSIPRFHQHTSRDADQ